MTAFRTDNTTSERQAEAGTKEKLIPFTGYIIGITCLNKYKIIPDHYIGRNQKTIGLTFFKIKQIAAVTRQPQHCFTSVE